MDRHVSALITLRQSLLPLVPAGDAGTEGQRWGRLGEAGRGWERKGGEEEEGKGCWVMVRHLQYSVLLFFSFLTTQKHSQGTDGP